MSSNNRNIQEDENSRKGEGISGYGSGKQTGPVAGGADNTRGENKPSHEGSSGGAKTGKDTQDKNTLANSANLSTTSRGADSSDKEFRNDQPNASTSQSNKSDKKD